MKKSLMIIGLFNILLQADLKQDIEFCKNINEDGARLKCYDRASKYNSQISTSSSKNESDQNKMGKLIYHKCSACHGTNAEKKALGESSIIAGWDENKIKNALLGYKSGTYGGAMKGVMKGQVATLNSTDIDALAKYIHGLSPINASNSNEDIGKWQEIVDIDPMTDKEIVILSLDAENQIHTQYAFQRIVPSLYIRCKDRKTEAYINWGTYLGLNTTQVTVRIDKQRKSIQTWGLSTDNKATFSPSGYSFAKKLLKHNKLIASTTPYGDNPVIAIFNIDGFENAAKKLRKSCGW
jgi:type VI secretion system protein VasI